MNADRWREIELVLDKALARTPTDWPAVLDESCSGDAELRAEVESLLRHADGARRYLDSPPVHLAAAMVGGADPAGAERSWDGRRVGAYRIVREIGRGGMSRVFLAERADGQFDQEVALKLLRPGLDTDIDGARFRAERQILASLNHPNIARLLDGGITDDGVPYLVLEYVDGVPIDRYCAERALSVRERLTVFRAVLDATQYAHHNLVVHRDLKPSNILVTPQGLVKLLEPSIETDVSFTRTGQRWMTPEYAAPEQVAAESITTLTDVYQLGAVLYELLTGAPPFGKRTRGLHELEDAVLHEESRPPSAAAGGRNELRGDVDAIVLKALRKEPNRRYASPDAFREDIDRFLAARPIRARPDTPLYRFRKFARRNAATVAASALAAAALVTTTALSIRATDEARQERDQARSALRRQAASVAFESLVFQLLPRGGAPMTWEQLLARGREVLERQYRGDPLGRIELGIQFAQHYLQQGNDSAGLTLVRRTVALADSMSELQMQARTRCEMAYAYARSAQPDSALAWLTRARPFLSRVKNVERGTLDACQGAEGDALVRTNPDSAAKLYRLVADRYVAAGDTADQNYASMLGDVGRALHMAGRDRGAVAIMMHVIDLQRGGFMPDPLGHAIALYNVTAALNGLGEYRSARDWLARRLPLVPSVDSAPEQAQFAAYGYGLVLYRLAELDSAAFWLNRALTRPDLLYPSFVLPTHYMLARIALARGRDGDARRHVLAADSAFPRLTRVPDAATTRAAYEIATLTDRMAAGATASRIGAMLDSLGYKPSVTSTIWIDPLLEAATILDRAGAYDVASRYAGHAVRIAATDSIAYRQSGIVGRAELLQARAALGLRDTVRARAAIARAVAPLTYGLGQHHPLTIAALALRDSIGR